MRLLVIGALLEGALATIPTTMKAVRANGDGCQAPFNCLKIENVELPMPLPRGHVLIKVAGTSVNPSDVDRVENAGCVFGCGADIAGTVVACPQAYLGGCTKWKVGDEVWGLSEGAYSEYVDAPNDVVGLKPKSLSMSDAGSIPEVALTSFMSLKRTATEPRTPIPSGSPWANGKFSNLTVVVTAGGGGTGFIGIQMAKAWGAKHIVTSTTSAEGFAFVKSLGADIVIDYKVQDIFDSLPDNSVDIVYDNYAKEGTADKAMRTIRPGGIYLMTPQLGSPLNGECYLKGTQGPPCLSANPKKGVRQLNYVTGPDFHDYGQQALEEIKDMFDAGKLLPHVDKEFPLDDAAKAFAYSAGSGEGGVGHHFGKIAMSVSSAATVIV